MFKSVTLGCLVCLLAPRPAFAGLVSTRSLGLCEVFLSGLEKAKINSGELVSVRFLFDHETAIVNASKTAKAIQRYIPELRRIAKPMHSTSSIMPEADEGMEILEFGFLPDSPPNAGRLLIAGHDSKWYREFSIRLKHSTANMQVERSEEQAVQVIGHPRSENDRLEVENYYRQTDPEIMRYGKFKSHQVVVTGRETTPIHMKVGEFLEIQFITPYDTLAADPNFPPNFQRFGWSRERELRLSANQMVFHRYLARLRAVKAGNILVERNFQLGRETPRPGSSSDNPIYSVSIPVEITDQ